MKSSHNKKQNEKTQKTKAKLQQELSKAHDSLKQQKIKLNTCHQELEQAKAKITALEAKQAEFASLESKKKQLQINLKNLSDESNQLKEEIEILKQVKQNLEEENEILNNPQKEIDPISEKDHYESIIKIDELTGETKSQQLQYMSAKADDEEPNQEESSVNISPRIPAEIDEHNPIQEEGSVKNSPPIASEIDEQQPVQEKSSVKSSPLITAEIEEQGPTHEQNSINITKGIAAENDAQLPAQENKIVKILPRFPSKSEQNVIQEVSLQQSNQVLKNSESISSQLPFSLCSRISLPVTPFIENADIDTPCYGIRVTVTEANVNNSIIDMEVGEDLIFGVTDYENSVEIPELEPGIYDINVLTIVPFARIKEHKSITIEVKD